MARQLFSNNAGSVFASTTTGALPQGGTALAVTPGQGSIFPTPTGGDYFLLTLYEKDGSGNENRMEIVKCTARTADTLTIVRNYEALNGVPPGGYDYPSTNGAVVYVQMRHTAGTQALGLQSGANLADLSSASSARANLGLTGYALIKDVKATTATYSASAWDSISLLYAGAITVPLPATPSDGDTIFFKVMNGLATNRVDPNGNNINGTSGNMTINISAGSFGLQYTTNTGDWRIV